jgi:hypothetical protein
MHNDLEYALFDKFPLLEVLHQDLISTGALRVMVSGSGSSLIALFPDKETRQQAAEKIKELLGESFFKRKKRVFLGGSKSITVLTDDEKAVIDEYIEEDYQILVGDCRGADTEIQKHLVERGYKNVKIYATDGEARNNVGNFKVIACHSMLTPEARARKDYFYYRIKDWRMLMLCDEILMFCDGNSRATRENLEDGLRMKKPTKVVLRPFEVRKLKREDEIT